MEKWKLTEKLPQLPAVSREQLPYIWLAAAGLMEVVFITMAYLCASLGFYLAEEFLVVPCFLFLGHCLGKKLNGYTGSRLLLSVVVLSWFVVSQIHHRLDNMGSRSLATVFFVYLMAFPFAALADDRAHRGIRIIGGLFAAASLVLVGYSGLLYLDRVPQVLADYVYWDGSRLTVLWHPNITAVYLMIGIGFSLALSAMAKKRFVKVLLVIAAVLQLAVMALTNCRTILLMTGAMLGGTAYYLVIGKVRKPEGKKIRELLKVVVLLLMIAPLVLVSTFKLSEKLYQANNARLVRVWYEEAVSSGSMDADSQLELNEDGLISSNNEQKSLSEDMSTLNGRTYIWAAARQAVMDDPEVKWWGTEYGGLLISAYNWFSVEHGHNSWVEVQLLAGLPGLAAAMVFTLLAAFSAAKLLLIPTTELWKKIIAMLTMCVMVAGFLEPYLFFAKPYFHAIEFIFIFCTGYLDYWCRPRKKLEDRI